MAIVLEMIYKKKTEGSHYADQRCNGISVVEAMHCSFAHTCY